MSDEIDSTINLNINVPPIRKHINESEKRKITGNRGQRIKARKSIKRLKEKLREQHDTGLISDEVKDQWNHDVDKGSLDFRKDVSERGRSSGKQDTERRVDKKGTGEVISSLFRRNPDIPSVQSSGATPVKEDLFSSDSFCDVPLHPYMISNLEKLGFTKMTSVQQRTIPHLIAGHDLLVKSQTGSGKTMAYAIPIVEDLCKASPKIQRSDGCHVVVIVPTRELALQSYDVFQKLLKPFTWLVPGCIMGGEKRKAEKARLRKGINILVATPGRLIDHIENTKNLGLDKIRWLVLDEADRLLDLGFEEKVSKIVQALDKTCSQRQTVLLSATLTEGVERLAGMSLKDPRRVSVSHNTGTSHVSEKSTQNENDRLKAHTTIESSDTSSVKFALPESLKQYFVISPCKLRLVVLLTLILNKCKRQLHKKMIVFVSTQDAVEFHYKLVQYLSTDHSSSSDVEDKKPTAMLDVYCLHGDMTQKERTATYQEFCTARSGVMICTDVAARGLHLPFVEWVIQYTCSTGVTDYVHRVGRTARAGTSGKSILFLLPSEIDFIKHLNQQNISLEEMKIGQILQDVTKLLPMLPGVEERQIPNTIEETATYLQNCCELYVKNDKVMAALAIKAYQSYIRAYATYPHDMKSIFHLRHLHLGHVAKMFALREAPSDIGNIPGVNLHSMKGKHKHRNKETSSPQKRRRLEQVSEYTSPLVFTSHRKKKILAKKSKSKLKSGPAKQMKIKNM